MNLRTTYKNGRQERRLIGEFQWAKKAITGKAFSGYFHGDRHTAGRINEIEREIKDIPSPKGFLETLAYYTGVLA